MNIFSVIDKLKGLSMMGIFVVDPWTRIFLLPGRKKVIGCIRERIVNISEMLTDRPEEKKYNLS